jgi:tripartite-type tricarboxylate transporter receptor subunit TctC
MRRLLLAAIAAIAVAAPARAQDFPSRDIRLLCGFAPGGTCDLLSRILAEKLTPILGHNVVVENRTGASGMIAADTVAKSPPDGHTVYLATMAIHAILPEMPGLRMPFDVVNDLTPIANVANVYNILIASPQAPFRTIPELIAYGRANPGRLTYASAGNGTSQHLSGELFKTLAGIDMLHVPYRGGAPALIDIAAGRTDMMFGNMPEFLGQIRGNAVRAIAFGAPSVSPLFPDLPLISRDLPGFTIRNWFGVAGAPRLPPAVLAKWNAALRQVAANTEFQRRMAENGMEIIVGSPEEFRATIEADRKTWGEVIRAAAIKAD